MVVCSDGRRNKGGSLWPGEALLSSKKPCLNHGCCIGNGGWRQGSSRTESTVDIPIKKEAETFTADTPEGSARFSHRISE